LNDPINIVDVNGQDPWGFDECSKIKNEMKRRWLLLGGKK
jgi:hypothetical protein